MITEQQAQQRIAEYTAQMQELRDEHEAYWYSEGLNSKDYTEQEIMYSRVQMDLLLGRWQELAKLKEQLQWVIGEIPGYELVSEDWRVWISSSENETVLQEQADKAKAKRTQAVTADQALEIVQFCYLIERRLAQLKERNYRPSGLFSEPVLTDRRQFLV